MKSPVWQFLDSDTKKRVLKMHKEKSDKKEESKEKKFNKECLQQDKSVI